MSTLPGAPSKGDKNKTGKFTNYNVNAKFKTKPLEQSKSTITKHGMQSLGKVAAVRRVPPPINLPSLKSENFGNDPAVNLVPSGGSGWGGVKDETPPGSGVPKKAPVATTSAPAPAVVSQPAPVVNGTTNSTAEKPPTRPAERPTPAPTTRSSTNTTWSSITSGGHREPPLPRAGGQLFQHEFPTLGAAPAVPASESRDVSLRPQTEGSWSQGGGKRGITAPSEGEGEKPPAPPPLMPHAGLPGAPFMYGPSNPPPQLPTSRSYQPPRSYDPHPSSKPFHMAQGASVIKGEEISRMDTLMMEMEERDDSWTRATEMDYEQKLLFSDDEDEKTEKSSKTIKSKPKESPTTTATSSHQSSFKIQQPPRSEQQRLWSGGGPPQPAVGYNSYMMGPPPPSSQGYGGYGAPPPFPPSNRRSYNEPEESELRARRAQEVEEAAERGRRRRVEEGEEEVNSEGKNELPPRLRKPVSAPPPGYGPRNAGYEKWGPPPTAQPEGWSGVSPPIAPPAVTPTSPPSSATPASHLPLLDSSTQGWAASWSQQGGKDWAQLEDKNAPPPPSDAQPPSPAAPPPAPEPSPAPVTDWNGPPADPRPPLAAAVTETAILEAAVDLTAGWEEEPVVKKEAGGGALPERKGKPGRGGLRREGGASARPLAPAPITREKMERSARTAGKSGSTMTTLRPLRGAPMGRGGRRLPPSVATPIEQLPSLIDDIPDSELPPIMAQQRNARAAAKAAAMAHKQHEVPPPPAPEEQPMEAPPMAAPPPVPAPPSVPPPAWGGAGMVQPGVQPLTIVSSTKSRTLSTGSRGWAEEVEEEEERREAERKAMALAVSRPPPPPAVPPPTSAPLPPSHGPPPSSMMRDRPPPPSTRGGYGEGRRGGGAAGSTRSVRRSDGIWGRAQPPLERKPVTQGRFPVGSRAGPQGYSTTSTRGVGGARRKETDRRPATRRHEGAPGSTKPPTAEGTTVTTMSTSNTVTATTTVVSSTTAVLSVSLEEEEWYEEEEIPIPQEVPPPRPPRRTLEEPWPRREKTTYGRGVGSRVERKPMGTGTRVTRERRFEGRGDSEGGKEPRLFKERKERTPRDPAAPSHRREGVEERRVSGGERPPKREETKTGGNETAAVVPNGHVKTKEKPVEVSEAEGVKKSVATGVPATSAPASVPVAKEKEKKRSPTPPEKRAPPENPLQSYDLNNIASVVIVDHVMTGNEDMDDGDGDDGFQEVQSKRSKARQQMQEKQLQIQLQQDKEKEAADLAAGKGKRGEGKSKKSGSKSKGNGPGARVARGTGRTVVTTEEKRSSPTPAGPPVSSAPTNSLSRPPPPAAVPKTNAWDRPITQVLNKAPQPSSPPVTTETRAPFSKAGPLSMASPTAASPTVTVSLSTSSTVVSRGGPTNPVLFDVDEVASGRIGTIIFENTSMRATQRRSQEPSPLAPSEDVPSVSPPAAVAPFIPRPATPEPIPTPTPKMGEMYSRERQQPQPPPQPPRENKKPAPSPMEMLSPVSPSSIDLRQKIASVRNVWDTRELDNALSHTHHPEMDAVSVGSSVGSVASTGPPNRSLKPPSSPRPVNSGNSSTRMEFERKPEPPAVAKPKPPVSEVSTSSVGDVKNNIVVSSSAPHVSGNVNCFFGASVTNMGPTATVTPSVSASHYPFSTMTAQTLSFAAGLMPVTSATPHSLQQTGPSHSSNSYPANMGIPPPTIPSPPVFGAPIFTPPPDPNTIFGMGPHSGSNATGLRPHSPAAPSFLTSPPTDMSKMYGMSRKQAAGGNQQSGGSSLGMTAMQAAAVAAMGGAHSPYDPLSFSANFFTAPPPTHGPPGAAGQGAPPPHSSFFPSTVPFHSYAHFGAPPPPPPIHQPPPHPGNAMNGAPSSGGYRYKEEMGGMIPGGDPFYNSAPGPQPPFYSRDPPKYNSGPLSAPQPSPVGSGSGFGGGNPFGRGGGGGMGAPGVFPAFRGGGQAMGGGFPHGAMNMRSNTTGFMREYSPQPIQRPSTMDGGKYPHHPPHHHHHHPGGDHHGGDNVNSGPDLKEDMGGQGSVGAGEPESKDEK